jgi:hypothetical protein
MGEPIVRPSTYGVIVKILERITRGNRASFFVAWFQFVFFSWFLSLLKASSHSHKINFYRKLCCSYRQDTKQADHAGRRLLSGVNYLLYNTGIWVNNGVDVSSQIFHHQFWTSKQLLSKNYSRLFP